MAEYLPQQVLSARRVRSPMMDSAIEGMADDERQQPRPGGRARWGGRRRIGQTVEQKETVD